MSIPSYLSRSIGLLQATVVLLASLFIGMATSVVYLGYSLSEQRNAAVVLSEEVLTVAESGAASAAWTLDIPLGQQVVQNILALHSVKSVVLVDANDRVLAVAERDVLQDGQFVQWFASTFIGKKITNQRALFINYNGSERRVGELRIELRADELAQSFLTLAVTVLIGGLIQALVIALVLLWLSSKFVTSPLQRLSAAITRIDPEKADSIVLPTIPFHEKNELGHLIQHTNHMLERLANTQEQLRKLATRDPLTDQPNRTLITDRLSRAIKHASRSQALVAVLFMDLNRFKTINDSLGHNIGDLLLIQTAKRLTTTLRNNDTVGRLGGDEFLVVLEGVEEIDEIVRTVQRITESISSPFFIEGHEILTSASIGIAVYPNDGDNTNTLMRCADLAMYEAKGGRSQWHFFATEMSDRVDSRLKTEAALSHALERDELFLVFQPKISLTDGSLAGCEALLRWREVPDSLTTQDFITIAEESGIIVDIGAWVLEEACRTIKRWSVRFGPIPISINVSARQLQEPDFVIRVLSIIKEYDIDPQLIELEITETVLLEALDDSFMVLGDLRKAGITISIDDFGTGYSSLAYLTRLPVDTLKIDRSFISGHQRSKAVLEMIVAMAKTLQLKTVAEGVETEGQLDWLTYEGCDYIQGYFISRPISAIDFENQFLMQALPLSETD